MALKKEEEEKKSYIMPESFFCTYRSIDTGIDRATYLWVSIWFGFLKELTEQKYRAKK